MSTFQTDVLNLSKAVCELQKYPKNSVNAPAPPIFEIDQVQSNNPNVVTLSKPCHSQKRFPGVDIQMPRAGEENTTHKSASSR